MDETIWIGAIGVLVFAISTMYALWHYVREDASLRGMNAKLWSWLSVSGNNSSGFLLYFVQRKKYKRDATMDTMSCVRYRNLCIAFMSITILCGICLLLHLWEV